MFENELAEKFKAIFSVDKVTYDTPGDSKEQKTLWIEVEQAKWGFRDGLATAMVTGNAVMYGRNDALTMGFFAKAIAAAPAALTKDLFFSDFESNTQRFRDGVQRGFAFTYFFRSQHDPAIGTITSVTTTVEES